MGTPQNNSIWLNINGDRQNVRIVTDNSDHPLMLFLHGGPGLCDRHAWLAVHSAMGKDYTLAFWDQRDSGKSIQGEPDPAKMSLEPCIDDTVEVIEQLCSLFHRDSLILVAHSWGSYLGVQAAIRYPERVAAYIGIGQFVDGAEGERLSYAFCLKQAEAAGDQKAIQELCSLVPEGGVYPRGGLTKQRAYVTKYGGANWRDRRSAMSTTILPLLRTREYGFGEALRYLKGAAAQTEALWTELVSGPGLTEVTEIPVPVLITAGKHDYQTPAAVAHSWFETLHAPYKKWVWFDASAHTPHLEEPELWEQEVRSFLEVQKEAAR